MKFLVTVLAVALATGRAWADPCKTYVAIQEGKPAPCDGAGMRAEELARFLKIENEKGKLELQLETAKRQIRDDAATCAKDVDIERRGRLACEREKSPGEKKPGLLQTPEFWGVTGAVLGVALTIAVVYATK